MTEPAGFSLHPRLAADCLPLGRFALSRLLLLNERRYPWFILVPERTGITELHQLDPVDRYRLSDESAVLSEFLLASFGGTKLNIAAIGNLVPQLHLHHVVRSPDDPAWPGTVWGRFEPLPYPAAELVALRRRFATASLPGFHGAD